MEEKTYSNCKKCGKSHEMVVFDNVTSSQMPMDHCKDYNVYGIVVTITEQVQLINDEEIIPKKLHDQYKKAYACAQKKYELVHYDRILGE